MENFLFKESQYDFDAVLLDAGYKATKSFEDFVTFSKKLDIKNEYSDKFKEIFPFEINITRPTKLRGDVKYENGSPYNLTFQFCVEPMHAIRRVQWDTFPGDSPIILDTIIKIVEAEAESCVFSFMKTSAILMEKVLGSEETEHPNT
jgi:hypothetical protein